MKSVVVEGSGASVAEIKTDKVILLMDVGQNLDILETYMTPLRIRYADLVVLTMCEDFLVTQSKINHIIQRIREINPKARIATSVLRPKPLSPLKGKKVFLATTADGEAVGAIIKHLEKDFGCHIVGVTRNLSNRPKLIEDLKALKKGDVVLTELKAAAIAIVAKEAKKLGLKTVLMDNIPTLIDKGGDVKSLEKEILGLFQ